MAKSKSKIEISLSQLRQRLKTLEKLIAEQWHKMNEYELYNGYNGQYPRMKAKLEELEAEQEYLKRAYSTLIHYQKCGIPYGDETVVNLTIQQNEVLVNTAYEFVCKCGESVITQNKDIKKIECPKCGKYIWNKSSIKLKIVRDEGI